MTELDVYLAFANALRISQVEMASGLLFCYVFVVGRFLHTERLMFVLV